MGMQNGLQWWPNSQYLDTIYNCALIIIVFSTLTSASEKSYKQDVIGVCSSVVIEWVM